MSGALYQMSGIVVACLGMVAVFAFICRIDPLRSGRHRESVLLMNQCLAIACVMASVKALQHGPSIEGTAVIVGTLAWLWVSYSTWVDGPPEWTRRQQS